jgi:hypothetical protein
MMHHKVKVKYEVFNTRTGIWEVCELSEEEIEVARSKYQTDFELYDAEKQITNAIIDQILYPNEIKSKD